jgi:hypothetical protein
MSLTDQFFDLFNAFISDVDPFSLKNYLLIVREKSEFLALLFVLELFEEIIDFTQVKLNELFLGQFQNR